MARLSIIELPDPRLRQVAGPVTRFDDALRAFIDDLTQTLCATSAIGLSATQVGVAKRVLALDLTARRERPEIYVNPEVIARSTRGIVEESCLSVPGVVGNLVRATQIRVRAVDGQGVTFERELSGMHAVALQHEVDHLDGVLFIDRLSWLGRLHSRVASRRAVRIERAATARA